jgi:hypothetical protein
MELFLFIAFVAICAVLLFRATKKSKQKVDLNHERKLKEKKARAHLLETPAVYTLACPDQPWHTRDKSATTGVSRTNPFSPKSESAELEYDGYSRRDRHHVTDLDAQIKDEDHIEEPAVSGSKRWGEEGLAH